MNPIFDILPSSVDADNCILICELSSEGFSYTIKDEVQNLFLGLAVYHYDKTIPPAGFHIALQILFHEHQLLSKNFKKTIIVYSFPQSVLIPYSLYDSQQNEDVLNLIHGDLQNNDTILTDVITEHATYNSFRVPTSIYDVIQT